MFNPDLPGIHLAENLKPLMEPFLSLAGSSGELLDAIRELQIIAIGIRVHCQRFGASVALFEYGKRRKHEYFHWYDNDRDKFTRAPTFDLSFEWIGIGAEAAVFAADHLSNDLKYVPALVEKRPQLKPYVDLEIIERARSVLSNTFPNIDTARNAVAHPENVFQQRPRGSNISFKKGGVREGSTFEGTGITNNSTGAVWVRAHISDNSIGMTKDGKYIEVPLTEEAIRAANEAYAIFLASVPKLDLLADYRDLLGVG